MGLLHFFGVFSLISIAIFAPLLAAILVYGYLVDIRDWRNDTLAWFLGYLTAWGVGLLDVVIAVHLIRH